MMRPLYLAVILLILAACAPQPRRELQSARVALTRAYHFGAQDLAPEEYQRASESLKQGEELVRLEKFEEALKLLSSAEEEAKEALAAARREKDRQEQLLAEAKRRARAAEHALQVAPPPIPSPQPIPPPRPRPAPKSPAPQPEARPAHPPAARYIVGADENLWTIAAQQEVYSDPLLWPLLYQANRDQIRDPRQVYPGQVLNIPRGMAPAELEQVREKARRSDLFQSERFPPGNAPSLP